MENIFLKNHYRNFFGKDLKIPFGKIFYNGFSEKYFSFFKKYFFSIEKKKLRKFSNHYIDVKFSEESIFRIFGTV